MSHPPPRRGVGRAWGEGGDSIPGEGAAGTHNRVGTHREEGRMGGGHHRRSPWLSALCQGRDCHPFCFMSKVLMRKLRLGGVQKQPQCPRCQQGAELGFEPASAESPCACGLQGLQSEARDLGQWEGISPGGCDHELGV